MLVKVCLDWLGSDLAVESSGREDATTPKIFGVELYVSDSSA